MNYLIKTTHALFTLILLAFAALQLNDPDPVIWIGFYLLCALVPAAGLLNRQIKIIFWLALLACGVVLGFYAEGAYNYYLHRDQEPLMQSMNPQKPYIEEAREFLGALITLGLVLGSKWLAGHYTKQ